MIILSIILILFILFLLYHFNNQYNIKIRQDVDYKLRRNILINLYNIIIDSAEETNTKPFLLYGTLLGYIRNKDLICYDYDLDFGIDINDYNYLVNNIINKLKKNNEYKLNIKDFLDYKVIEIIHKKTRISADIFSFVLKNNYYYRNVPKIYSKYYLKEKCIYMPKNWIKELKMVKFLNRTTYIPNKSKELLKCYYGKKFIIPNHKCDKKCSNCKEIKHL
jgi:phosphorylcholine metabolism protein LicD